MAAPARCLLPPGSSLPPAASARSGRYRPLRMISSSSAHPGIPPPPTSHVMQESKRYYGTLEVRQRGTKTHICAACDFPIAVYGRCAPCLHAYCLTCAASMAQCIM